jgi:hypothetical protein
VRAAGEQCGRRCDGVEALAKQLIWPFSATRRPMNRWWASRPVGVQESDPVLGGPLFPSLDQMTSHVMWFPVGAMRMGDMGQSAEFGKFLKRCGHA